MRYVVMVSLVVVAIIHLVPLSGAVGRSRLEALYGIPIADPNLEILMRHRAVLFGLLGVFILVAAFVPRFQAAAFVLGFISVLSFLWFARARGDCNAQVRRIVAGDNIALLSLVVGSVVYAFSRVP